MKKLLILLLILPALALAASGDRFDLSGTAPMTGYKLLDAQSTTSNGVWVDARKAVNCSVRTTGLEGGGTIDVQGSAAETVPSNATAGVSILAAAIAADSHLTNIAATKFPVRWIKATKTQGGAPTATTVILWCQTAAQ